VFILCSVFLYSVTYAITSSPSVVTIGSGYINVECPDFVPLGTLIHNSGNINVTSQEVASAFVGQIGSDDFTLHKQQGTEFGDTNIGIFTLKNGAKAYVATTNSTSLIIELTNGEYIIVGTTDTQALTECFSQNVHQLTP